ncbi:Tubulin-specific chaperone D [Hypsibius exemplaris]|uniref:Tubulin-specific chaperone D n=1 Tax=Hypsibius exemplaris TaxID=2072580 RepID=A0A1W0WVB5_HYPEX|nr:Tubulin-specific chaperone D [Hypsibius exemplaris]
MEEGAPESADGVVNDSINKSTDSAANESINKSADDGHGEDPTEETHVSFALRRFENEEFITTLIKDIPKIVHDSVDLEARTERLKDLLDRYQEQPQLVDPYLGPWIADLMLFVKKFAETRSEENKRTADLCLTILRMLTKLRGYKIILRYLPHHVGDVEQSLSLVEESQRQSGFVDWEQQYMLLLWLSIAIQIPFDLKKLTDPDDIGTERSIDRRVLQVCKNFVVISEKTRDAAAYLLSRFVTRPDALPLYGAEVIEFLLTTLKEAVQDIDRVKKPHVICGCLAAIAALFKSGTRNQLESLAAICAPRLVSLDLLASDFSIGRKFYVKALQRIALTFLPAKLPSWRYKRGYRSLEENMTHGGIVHDGDCGDGDGKENLPPKRNGLPPPNQMREEEDIEVPEMVEEIIGLLLRGLHDNDGIVRWSAAKGIGRISERLPLSFAEDIQNGVFQLFSYEKAESAWHGGCLALAELSRRGALLPSRFSDVIPIVLKALLYEELRGTFAVGSQVRDAGCYVCWAFARAYEPKDLSQFVADIAKTLVLTALFDRSVNCRRAASAAFQEHVGRQGNFPHGLDIIPILDFEALGRRTNTYLKLSTQIAKYPEYCTIMLEFLLSHRLAHWEAPMRELAAQTLLLLTPFAPGYVIDTVIPEILSRVGSEHLFTRHGALIALGCVCEGLHKCGRFDQRLASKVESVLLQMEPGQVYRGLGHELVREAVMNLIGRVSSAELPFTGKYNLLNQMLKLIEVNLLVESVKIQELAVATLASFLKTYGGVLDLGTEGKRQAIQDRCFQTLLTNLTSPSEVVRRSSVLALSVLPVGFVDANERLVIQTLVGACPRATHSEARWVDCRKNCCRALEKIVEVSSELSSDSYSLIFDFLSDCLNDYTEDKRGNIGRIVRLASLETTKAITLRIAKKHPGVLTSVRMEVVIKSLARLFAEAIPDIRSRAGQNLLQLCKSSVMPDFFCKPDLLRVFNRSSTSTRSMMFGLISSLGSLTQSTVRESNTALRKYYRDVLSKDVTAVKSFAISLRDTLQNAIKEERLLLPALNTLMQVFAAGIFCGNLDEQEPQLLIDLLDTVQHVRRSQGALKVTALVEIYSEALQFSEPVRGLALQRMLPFLTHVFPRIRTFTATKLHESIMTYDEIVPAEASEAVSDILNETEWGFSLEKSQVALAEIGQLLHIQVKPMLLKPKQAK